MHRAARRIPSYRLHKPSGQARVVINGEHICLGKYGTTAYTSLGHIRDSLGPRCLAFAPFDLRNNPPQAFCVRKCGRGHICCGSGSGWVKRPFSAPTIRDRCRGESGNSSCGRVTCSELRTRRTLP